MYGVNKNTKSAERVDNVAGINEGMKLVKVVAESASPKNPDSQVVINAYFNNGRGGFDVKHTIFELKASEIKEKAANMPQVAKFSNQTIGIEKGKVITPQQALDLAIQQFNGNLKALFNKFIPEDEIDIPGGDDWKSFAKNVEAFYNKHKDSITNTVRLFLVYDKSGRFLNPRQFNWIESMSVNPTKLKATDKDNLTPATPDKESSGEQTEVSFDSNENAVDLMATDSSSEEIEF